jgi:DNA-binding transcriptional ArsR family regulator
MANVKPNWTTEPTTTEQDTSPSESTTREIDTAELLSLLSDEYARKILRALGEEPLSIAAVEDRLDISKTTAYRRLDRLESAGVVEESLDLRPDGHHRRQFRLCVERTRIRFGSDGLTAEADR